MVISENGKNSVAFSCDRNNNNTRKISWNIQDKFILQVVNFGYVFVLIKLMI